MTTTTPPDPGWVGVLVKVRNVEGVVPFGSCGTGYISHGGPALVFQGWLVFDAQKAGRVWRLSRCGDDALIVTGSGYQYKDGLVVEEFPGIEDWESDDGN